MKKISVIFIFFYSCLTMGIRGDGSYIFNPYLKKEIKKHGFDEFDDYGYGFSFGIGAFHPDYALIRGKFSQLISRNSKTKFYTQEGWIEGGANIFKTEYFSIFPVLGFGALNEIVNISKRFEGISYGICVGIENHLILTKEKPGYLAFTFGANYKRISGSFLEAPFDFLISKNHSYYTIFFGIEMGFIYEE